MHKLDDVVFENLAKKYPELFQKSPMNGIFVGEGWLPLIDTLCEVMSKEINELQNKIRCEEENKNFAAITSLNEILNSKINSLPTIIRINEKYGRLEFKILEPSARHSNFIDIISILSSKMCEVCGKPGEPRNNHGKVKTYCDSHHKISGHDFWAGL